jgi:hypothetical protein
LEAFVKGKLARAEGGQDTLWWVDVVNDLLAGVEGKFVGVMDALRWSSFLKIECFTLV